jgi:hypothetical protein
MGRSRESHEQKNEARKERSRAQYSNLADVGKIPLPADPKRRESCRLDARRFLVSYFPASTGLKPFSSDHERVIARIQSCVLDGGNFCEAVYRGFAKTTISENSVIWATLYGHRRFVPLFGADASSAGGNIDSIKTELSENELLLADFPEVCHPIHALEGKPQRCASQTQTFDCPICKGEPGHDCGECGGAGRIRQLTHIEWTADTIVLPTVMVPEGFASVAGARTGAELIPAASSGAILTARGITAASRGMKHKRADGTQQRPDFVIIDDPQTDESARSPVQVQKRLNTIRKSILKLGGHNKKIAVVVNATVIERGDLVEQILDPKKFPAWQGERIKMVKKWATAHETLWLGSYAETRSDFDPNDLNGQLRAQKKATAFYKKNRRKMDAGCVVSWKHCFDPDTEISAIQHAYNCLIDDGDEVFASECQQEPIEKRADNEVDAFKADELGKKLNGLPRGVLPDQATHLVVFIDPKESVLPWLALATDDQFNCWIVDYGVYPDQGRSYFAMRDAKKTLAKATGVAGAEARVYAGLDALTNQLMARDWRRSDGTAVKPGKILIDANLGKITEIVKKFCVASTHAAVLTPSHGKFIGATGRPMREWSKRPGDRVGLNWKAPAVKARSDVRHVVFDTNFWKSFAHTRLATPMGARGCMSVFGKDSRVHQMLGDHLAAERPIEVSARGRSVIEWKQPPGVDNDFFDSLVGCCVGASMLGVSIKELKGETLARIKIKLSELQKQMQRRSVTPTVETTETTETKPAEPSTVIATPAPQKKRIKLSELQQKLREQGTTIMADDLTDSIEENAAAPKRASGDTGSMESHSLPDQIAADRYIKANKAARRGLGIRHVKLIPPGASDINHDRC